LARTQARQVGQALSRVSGRDHEIVALSSTGDDHKDRAVEAFDTKGIFVDRIREAVLAGDCHLAVHSHKDLPTRPADGLVVPVVPRRVDPRDALVTREGWRLVDLPRDRTVTVGTSSARRRAQLSRARRDLLVQPLRGNVETRLGKVRDGILDGVVVAAAGLLRLGDQLGDLLDEVAAVPLEHGEMLHAPAQGALALECRTDDLDTQTVLRLLDHRETRLAVGAERRLLADLEGGCTAPIGAHARVVDDRSTPQVELLGMLSDASGTNLARTSQRGAVTELAELAAAVASSLRSATGLGPSGTP
jgi:hydroxymethylbilane synthase